MSHSEMFRNSQHNFSKYHITDDDSKVPFAQYLITNDTNSASFGDLSHIINFDDETICIKFESNAGKIALFIHITCIPSFSIIISFSG